MKYYIADMHFFHEKIIHRMDNRQFNSIEQMHEYMIYKWNNKVNQNDQVFILGDLSFGNIQQTEHILRQLKGKLYMIRGNHDKVIDEASFDASRFEWIKDYAEIQDNVRDMYGKISTVAVILCHYPIMMYKGQYKTDSVTGQPKVYMMHGHIHDTMDNKLLDRYKLITRQTLVQPKDNSGVMPIQCNIINCFCMFSDYTPLSLQEWIIADELRMQQKGGY